jgi:amino acid adenylation domain-containing protein
MTAAESIQGLGFQLSAQQRRIMTARKDWRELVCQIVVRVEGEFEPFLLKSAIDRIVVRHEILRTTFEQVRGIREPIQMTSSEGSFVWKEILCDPDGQTAEQLSRQAAKDFKLYAGPPLHVLYASANNSIGMLVFTIPAMCGDEATLHLLAADLIREYSGDSSDSEDAASVRLQYLQFSEWQNSLLNDEDSEAGRTYWQNQIAEVEDKRLVFPFETSGSRTSEQATQVATTAMIRRAEEVRALSESGNLSLEALLFTAWNILLWRLSGKQIISSWITLSGRDHEMLASICGPVASSIPFRAELNPDATFLQTATGIQASLRESMDWGFMYRPELFEDQQLENLRISFEVAEPVYRMYGGEIQFRSVYSYCCTEDIDLKLSLVVEGDFIQLRLYFNADRFSVMEMHELAHSFDALIEQCELTQKLEDLSFWKGEPQSERSVDGSGDVSFPTENCTLGELFEEQVERTPSRLAVLCGEEAVTFEELNRRANQVANYLISSGVVTEDRIAICLERSSELLVAVLASLKASAAYVPIDMNYPRQRIVSVLDEAECHFVLTQRSLRERFDESGCRIICLDDPRDIPLGGEENLPINATPESLAYVIFTSGSTGKPKGVMVSHSSVIGLLEALEGELKLKDAAPFHVAMNAPLAFDASVKQWIHLLRGRTVCILREEERIDPSMFREFLHTRKINLLDATPTHFRAVLDQGLDGVIQEPLTVLLGGEDIDEKLWGALQSAQDISFYNLYGPTECTVDVSAQFISNNRLPSIGGPLAGREMFILDHRWRPLPKLFPGELYVGGDCLARGYIRQPRLTAERFIPNPFGKNEAARLYRTGDIACCLENGSYRFLGRADDQVKLRGHRVELGEIASVLREVSGVQDVFVLVRGQEQRLLAYAVREAGASISIETLRQHAQKKLPPYMMPSGFAIINRFPLTVNGKVDRSALPEIERDELSSEQELPRSELETALAGVWRDVLGLRGFGIHDNFFEIGGNSLLMVQVHNKIRETFGRSVSMVELFRHPTIALLSQCLSGETVSPSVQRGQDRGARRAAAMNRFKR